MRFIYTFAVITITTIILGIQNTSASSLDNMYSQYDLTPTEEESSKPRKFKSSFELDYNLFTDQVSVGGSLVLEGLVFTGEYGSFTNLSTGVKSKTSWSAGFGLNKRVYICNFLYFEGRLGADYSDIKMIYEEEINNNTSSNEATGKWGGFANIRAGLKVFNNTCVNFGSKWKFSEFNLTNEYTTNYCYIGLTFLF